MNLDVIITLDVLFTARTALDKPKYNTILNELKLKAKAAASTDHDLVAVNALLK